MKKELEQKEKKKIKVIPKILNTFSEEVQEQYNYRKFSQRPMHAITSVILYWALESVIRFISNTEVANC